MLISDLLKAIDVTYKGKDLEIGMITDDSRKCEKNSLFVCHEKGEAYVEKAIQKLSEDMFDIIYVDPPYYKEMGIDAINRLSEKNVLKDGGVIILETDTNEVEPDEIGRYEKYNYKRYGRNILSLFRRKE